MGSHDAVDSVSLFFEQVWIDLEFVGNVYALYDEHVSLFFDFADGLGFKVAVACGYSARLKGTAEGAGHSTAGCCDYVVEGCGVRL